jgi:hypothetical protein
MLIYSGNSAVVSGSVFVTNSGFSSTLAVYGSLTNSGLVVADQIVCNNGLISFPANTIMTRSAGITNGKTFFVGDGTRTANYVMQGGTHSFNSGLAISNNSILSGCGTVNGNVTNYGTILLNGGCDMYFNGRVMNYGKIISANNATPHFPGGLVDFSPTQTVPKLTSDGGLGITAGQFGFTIEWNTGKLVVVEASSDFQNWTPVQTNTMPTSYFYVAVPTATGPGGTFFRVKASQ